MAKLPNLRHISVQQLSSAEKADQPLLEGKHGARRSAFQFLHKLTSLELGSHSQAPVTPDELQGISHLTNLQHISINQGLHCVPVPYNCLIKLTSLTSIEVDRFEPGLCELTRLKSLSFLPHNHFVPCSEAFSSLQALTALAVGSIPRDYRGIGYKDLPKFNVLSNLQKLTLTGLMGCFRDPDDRSVRINVKVWSQLASFTSVKHLELKDVCHTYGAFPNLAKMTQLTCLTFFPAFSVNLEGLADMLAVLSALTNLDVLKCQFSFYQWDQDCNFVEDSLPVPDVGCVLKAALPQAASMSVFAVESKRLRHSHYDSEYNPLPLPVLSQP